MSQTTSLLLQTAFFKGVNPLTLLIVAVVVVAFVMMYLANRIVKRRMKQTSAQISEVSGIMLHALDQGNIHVVRFIPALEQVSNVHGGILPEGSQPTLLFMDRIHPDDRAAFDEFLKQLSSKRVEEAECVFRFRASATPSADSPWRSMGCQAIADTSTVPLSIICALTDETETVAEQQQERELTDKYRLIFDHSFVGMSFYDSRGRMLAANQEMRSILRFQGNDDPFYYGTEIFDLPIFHDVIDRRHVDELYFCTRGVIPERGVNIYMEIRLHPICDDMGQLLNMAVAARDVTEERDLYRRGLQSDRELKRTNEDIRLYEGELRYLLENSKMLAWRALFDSREMTFFKELNKSAVTMTFDEFASHIVDDEGRPVSELLGLLEASLVTPSTKLFKTRHLLGNDSVEWYVMNTIPEHDEAGRVTGCFGLIRNVSSLMFAQEQLRQETERANDSGRLKSVFLANMTHEIRTPLNAIVGFSDVLTMVEDAADKREMVRVIMNNCDMLLRLINDILEISAMDSEAMVLEPEAVDFSQAFNDICETLRQRVQLPTVQFVADNPYDTLPTYLDTRRVQQVVTNFVTNAVKYTTEGHIKVGYRLATCPADGVAPANGDAASPAGQGLYIYCEDTGTGIPKEKQASVFERFVKLNDYVQGTGLGLSICKSIASRANGRIGVRSEGEGHGSTFWLWIPCEVRNAG